MADLFLYRDYDFQGEAHASFTGTVADCAEYFEKEYPDAYYHMGMKQYYSPVERRFCFADRASSFKDSNAIGYILGEDSATSAALKS